MGEKMVWCGICAKYLAFSTYPTSTVGALMGALITYYLNICYNIILFSHKKYIYIICFSFMHG